MQYSYKYENPFNVEAEWICHLRALDENMFFQHDLRKTFLPPQDLDKEVGELFQKLPYLSDGKLMIRFGVPQDEKKIVQQWIHYSDFTYMLHFLSAFTGKLSNEIIFASSYFYSITHTAEGKTKEFESLNSNTEETGLLILPLVKTINDPLDPAREDSSTTSETEKPNTEKLKKHWATDRIPGIQVELAHTFYINKKDLEYSNHQYGVLHSVLQRHIFPENKKTLRIAVCPLAHKDILCMETYYKNVEKKEQGLCCADGLKNEDFVYDRIQAAFLTAGKERADIIIFPEMLGNEKIISQRFFAQIKEAMRSRGYPMPGLTLLPTWWHQNQNELYVMDASGKLLCTQQKQVPYIFEDKDSISYAEDLRNPERVIHVVHIPDVGRFAFPICKDFLEEEYIRIMLRQLRTTFLLCPSFSPSKTQFDLTAPGVIKYGCYTIWCNTCAAYYLSEKPPAHVGLIAGPQAFEETMKVLCPNCEGNCGDESNACVFLVEISMDHTATITYRHIYR